MRTYQLDALRSCQGYFGILSRSSCFVPVTVSLLFTCHLAVSHYSTPMEYLEYDEEQGDDLFGSDSEANAKAGSSTQLPTFNSAKPLNQGGIPLVGSLKGKEKARAKDPQDRLDELRFMRMYKSPVHTGKGPRSLKEITQDGQLSGPMRHWVQR